jgi:hypothetical protein
MVRSRRRIAPAARVATVLVVALGAAWIAPRGAPASYRMQTLPLPERLTDSDLWKLTTDFSEPGGYFQSDNFTSNEAEIGQISTDLRASGRTGGAYLGVGPEQNFTYIAAIRPKIAFLFDIRRQAIIQQFMYKAIFELSPTRADFVSLLFSKSRPAGLDTMSPMQKIWDGFGPVATDAQAHARNLVRIKDQLRRVRGFQLSGEDEQTLDYVYNAFFTMGPGINSGGRGGGGGGGGGRGGGGATNFLTLTLITDGAGTPRSFLATEADYRVVKEMHAKNLIIPVVGDFGGPKAIRAVGAYLTAHGTAVTAFYVSNVEQYLFQSSAWQQFYRSVGTLPVDASSTFIRPYSMRRPTNGSALCPIAGFVRAFSEGRVTSNNDALACIR